jgi:hypothetical protein
MHAELPEITPRRQTGSTTSQSRLKPYQQLTPKSLTDHLRCMVRRFLSMNPLILFGKMPLSADFLDRELTLGDDVWRCSVYLQQ